MIKLKGGPFDGKDFKGEVIDGQGELRFPVLRTIDGAPVTIDAIYVSTNESGVFAFKAYSGIDAVPGPEEVKEEPKPKKKDESENQDEEQIDPSISIGTDVEDFT